jgi:hypothetical protein
MLSNKGRYLDPGNYLGIDKEPKLIEFGISRELGRDLEKERRPQLIVSERFEFKMISKRPD